MQDGDKAVPSSIAFNGSNKFVVQAGHGGRAPDMAGVKRTLDDLIANPGRRKA
ncbi:creatinine amidohydrolase/Fe(II)-dependent formamide hydrolase-like protein [Bifidobacterium commune]|uniref:hypothetical protein n=1 Tax=Bifidobacterium commune TaxID=1505727 RepID=UPI001605E913|nr:hypothetical protein [Bifidobacterium commune]MBB2955662.1 creatinine amidohydrolase/Fe(II)-dependent formamide hydrolase-like protein [Bifidobacterium commune]